MSLTLTHPTVVHLRPPTGSPEPRRARVPRPSVDTWIRLALMAAVLVVQAVNITGYPALGDDEGTYLSQAWAVQQGQGLAHYTYWYDHPPVGWLQIAALSWLPALLMPEHLAVANARVVMLVFTLASVALLYTLARRLTLPRWACALAAAAFALSPLAITLQRQMYLDNIAVAWMLGAMVLVLSPQRALWHHVAAGGCAAVAVLSKETMVIVLPALLLLLWRGAHPSTRKFSFAGFGAVLVLVGAVYPLYALLNNELVPGDDHVSLFDGIVFQLSRQGSGSFLLDGTGSRAIVESWLYYDHVLVVAGLACAAVAIVALAHLRAPALAVLLLLLMAMRPGYLPGMYVIQALPFLALCLAGVAAGVVGAVLTWRARPARVDRLVRRAAVVLAAAAVLGTVLPGWVDRTRVALTADLNGHNRAAVDHLAAMPHPPATRVLVDGALWLDLVRDGYEPGAGAIWFYKLDLDPAISRQIRWQDVDYVVSSPIMRSATDGLPSVVAALEHSVPVATFGAGGDRVEIRRVLPS